MKIKVIHYRIPERSPRRKAKDKMPSFKLLKQYNRKQPPFVPQTKGGKTEVFILSNDGAILSQGIAYCSMSDNFNYMIGREIALNRANLIFTINKEE